MPAAESLLTQLPYAHWHIVIEFRQSTTLEAFKGNVLHGGFGRSLAVVSAALYQALFCQPAADNQWVTPFAIFSRDQQQVFTEGSCLQFEFVLLGEAARQQQAVLDSLLVWQVLGLGTQRARFQLMAVTDPQGAVVFQAGQLGAATLAARPIAHFMPKHALELPADMVFPVAYQLQTITRCRLQYHGQPLRQAPALALFCQMIQRRFTQLLPKALRGSIEPAASALLNRQDSISSIAELPPLQAQVQFHDWQRFSAKEQRQVLIGGLEGSWLYPQVDAAHYFWLQLGELIGVGNKSSFGFGRYGGQLTAAGAAAVGRHPVQSCVAQPDADKFVAPQ